MAGILITPQGRQSFFDDDNPELKFDWAKMDKTPYADIIHQTPLQSDNWTRTHPNLQTPIQGYFLLYPRVLVQLKNDTSKQPEVVLEISNSKMKLLPSNAGVFGFSLSKNETTYEFTTKDENVMKRWTNELKGTCILTTFHEEYKAIKMIGRGSFAKVYLVEAKSTGKSYAVKAFTKEGIIFSNKSNAKPSMINEIDIMRCLNHENVIQLYEVYETEKSIYLVLELIQGKSLQDILKKQAFREQYLETKIVKFVKSLLEALAYLASKNIMHRDLKPDNILVDKGDKIKIVDFGLATFINIDDYIFKKCGTPGYIAPEVFKYDPKTPTTHYDDRCDVFSVGCILFYMLFGCPFFDGTNASEILKLNRKFTVEFEALKTVAKELQNPASKIPKEGLDLLSKLLEFNHKLRPTAAEALKHPFLSSFNNGDTSKPINNLDAFSDPFSKLSDAGSFSPKNTKHTEFSPTKPTITLNKEKYEQKDSLYIDVGQPLMNGRTDTLNSGVNSHNNSLLLAGQTPTNAGLNSSPLSKFATGNLITKKESSRGRGGGGNDLLKAAIFKNAEKNINNNQGYEDESPSPIRLYDSNSFTGRSNMAMEYTNDTDEVSNENTQVQQNVEKTNAVTQDKHPSKIDSPKGGLGNSPTYAKNLKYPEESKSPSDK